VVNIRRGEIVCEFDVEEWTCVRYGYNNYEHSGAGSVLILGGEINVDEP
jgi:hypothetical protein